MAHDYEEVLGAPGKRTDGHTESSPRRPPPVQQRAVIARSDAERLAQGLFHAAKERRITLEQLGELQHAFILRDERGGSWTVGLKTQQWHRSEAGRWVPANPPERLTLAAATFDQLSALERARAAPPGAHPQHDGRGRGPTVRESRRPPDPRQPHPESLEARNRGDVHCENALLARSRGDEDLVTREWDLALQAYDVAIRLAPDDAVNYNLRGTVHWVRKHFRQARDDFQKAIALDPEFALAYSNLGLLYLDIDAWQQAIPAFKKALELDPSLKVAQAGLKKALAKKKLGIFIGVVSVVGALGAWYYYF